MLKLPGIDIDMTPPLSPDKATSGIASAIATTMVLVLALVFTSTSVSAFPLANEIRPYGEGAVANGYARKDGSSAVFYTETYLDDPMNNIIRAVYWDGNRQPISYKQLDFGVDPNIPKYFEVIDYRRERGYRVTVKKGFANVKKLKVSANGSETVTRNHDVQIDSRTVIDAGFQRFVVANWDRLTRGKTVRINFLQIDKARLVPLKIKLTKCDTPNTTCFKITFDNFLLQGMVPTIYMKYETDTKRLIRYTGLGPITELNGKGLPVDIIYEYLP